VAKEDFNKAMDIKEKLKKLIAKRDSYDALYETSRYEQMVVLARPTTADMRALQQQLEDQDNYERMRRQKELEEDERRRILEHQKQI
jgi:centrosomal protein CEP104